MTVDQSLQKHMEFKETLKTFLNDNGAKIGSSTPYRDYLPNWFSENYFTDTTALVPRPTGSIASRLLSLNAIAKNMRNLFLEKPSYINTPYFFKDQLEVPVTLDLLKKDVFKDNHKGFHFTISEDIQSITNWRVNLFDRTDLSTLSGQRYLSSAPVPRVKVLSNGSVGRELAHGNPSQYFYLKGDVIQGETYTFSCYMETEDNSKPILGKTLTPDLDACFVFENGTRTVDSITLVGGSLYRIVVSFIATSNTSPNLGFVKYIQNSTKSLSISSFQLEKGTVASAYQEFKNFKEAFRNKYPNHNMYQEAEGVTPVYAYKQSVGLWLDYSYGTIKRDVLYNSKSVDFSTWVLTEGTASGNTFTSSGLGSCKLPSLFPTTLNVIEVKIKGNCTTSFNIKGTSGSGLIAIDAGDFDFSCMNSLIASLGKDFFLEVPSGGVLRLDSILINDIKGNSAKQATTAARPLFIKDEDGFSCLSFDGVDDYLLLEGKEKYTYLHNGKPFSLFITAKGASKSYNTVLVNNNLGSLAGVVGVSFALDLRSVNQTFATFRNGTSTSFATSGLLIPEENLLKPITVSFRRDATYLNHYEKYNYYENLRFTGNPSQSISTRELFIGKSEASTSSSLTGNVYNLFATDVELPKETHNLIELQLQVKGSKAPRSLTDLSETALNKPLYGSDGFYINPNIFTNMYTDAYGITPCKVNQRVGLILDKTKKYIADGIEKKENISVIPSPSSVTASPEYYTFSKSHDDKITLSGFESNKIYRININIIAMISGTLSAEYKGVSSPFSWDTIGMKYFFFHTGNTASDLVIRSSLNTSTNFKISLVSIQEYVGNHFTQEAQNKRPFLRFNSTYNTYYLDFDGIDDEIYSVQPINFSTENTAIISFNHKTTSNTRNRCLFGTSSSDYIYSKGSDGLFLKNSSSESKMTVKANETISCNFSANTTMSNGLYSCSLPNCNPTATPDRLFIGSKGNDSTLYSDIQLYGFWYKPSRNEKAETYKVERVLGKNNKSTETFSMKTREVFIKGEKGFSFDFNNFETMYQDASGRIPVTSINQPIGLVLDALTYKNTSKNLANVSKIFSQPISETTNIFKYPISDVLLEPNQMYEIKFKVTNANRVSEDIGMDSASFGTRIRVTGNGEYTFRTFSSGDVVIPSFFTRNSFSATISDISIKRIYCNYAYQETTSYRPTLVASSNNKGVFKARFDGVDDFLTTNVIDLGNNSVSFLMNYTNTDASKVNSIFSGSNTSALKVIYGLDHIAVHHAGRTETLNTVTPEISLQSTFSFNKKIEENSYTSTHKAINYNKVSKSTTTPTTSVVASSYYLGKESLYFFKGDLNFLSVGNNEYTKAFENAHNELYKRV